MKAEKGLRPAHGHSGALSYLEEVQLQAIHSVPNGLGSSYFFEHLTAKSTFFVYLSSPDRKIFFFSLPKYLLV